MKLLRGDAGTGVFLIFRFGHVFMQTFLILPAANFTL
jgi:hypothetical protein